MDVGSKTVGVAVSDPFGWTAQCAIEDQELLEEKASMVVAKYDTFE
ncbi:hypothetical protein [Enterococcus mundtii]|nr:hypothetical protein [Enterococcus mundtii]